MVECGDTSDVVEPREVVVVAAVGILHIHLG
jgi:hypothetical protein